MCLFVMPGEFINPGSSVAYVSNHVIICTTGLFRLRFNLNYKVILSNKQKSYEGNVLKDFNLRNHFFCDTVLMIQVGLQIITQI